MSVPPLEQFTAPNLTPAAPADAPPPYGWSRPTAGFMSVLGFTIVAVNGALLVPGVLTLSLKTTAIDAASATTALSLVVSVASVFALIGFPLIGRLSDRTTSRFGRRRPYLVAAAVLIAAGALLTWQAQSTLMLVPAHILTTLGVVCGTVAASALVPDHIDPAHRGPSSAVIGLGLPVGAIVGLFIAQLVAPNLGLMIMLPAGLAVVATLLMAVVMHDHPLDPEDRPAFSVRDLLSTYWVNPAKSPSFGWAWVSRLLLFLGVAAVNAYQAFYLIIVQHVAPADVAGKIFLATLVLVAASLVFAPVAGKISDLVGRTKPFVIGAALVFAVGLTLVSQATTFTGFLVAIGIMGVGQGIYFAVDFALVTKVLPDPSNPAKDLGIMNLASNLPGFLVPAAAPVLLAIGASATNPQNFTALFVAGAIAAALGALAILPIRKVR